MSDGKCGKRQYNNISQAKVERGLEALRKAGATVRGNNPWDIDTHKYGVKLRGTWLAAAQRLDVIVTAKGLLVPCRRIWATIDELIDNVREAPVLESSGDAGTLLPDNYGDWEEPEQASEA